VGKSEDVVVIERVAWLHPSLMHSVSSLIIAAAASVERISIYSGTRP
jgi:hypothetical protein